MAIAREFLGFDQPALATAADYLIDRFGRSSLADLRHVIVVVTGSRAGRRLLEILVDRAEAKGPMFAPPQIATVGQLPELLYQAKKPFADELTQQLAWAAALRNFDRSKLASIVADRPQDGDSPRWLDLGRLLRSLHRELASDGLTFSDVVLRGDSPTGFEKARWQTLAEIQHAYLETLDGLGLWDRQTARLFAIAHRECCSDRPIVLVGVADLNRSLRQMLDQVADRVTALVYAPPAWADWFDSHGGLCVEAWQEVELPIPDESLLEADSPVDQADQVARRMAQFDGRFRAEQITIGVPDERIVSQLVRQLDECQLPNRYGPGQPLARSGPYRLLEDLAAFARSGRYAEFARLVRNPDVEAWLTDAGVQPGWLGELDDYYNQHLPRGIDGGWLGSREDCRRLCDVYERAARLTRRLHGERRPIHRWLPEIREILFEVYGGREFDLANEADQRTWKACATVQDSLDRLAGIPEPLLPNASGAEALGLLLEQCRTERMEPAADDAAIELVGWLELPLDDAPALIVTSFNEGFVPSSVNADLFLPGGLRSALGLDDNARRYARDAYAVATLLAPWRNTTFIVARRDPDGYPLAPSRLLFAVPPDAVAQRALRFFAEAPRRPVQPPLAGGLVSSPSEHAFDVPLPQPLSEPITQLSVTSFKKYLACPYRFYLDHVLKLSHIDDDATELDGASFGKLAHAVLEHFGRSVARDATDADAIERELSHRLDELVRERFGGQPGAVLLVQIEQLRLRLQALARWQADWAAEGWRIEHAELDQDGRLDVDGTPIWLTARIDRIDFNERTGRRIIFDYKTSDVGDLPEKTHRKKSGEWVDLQLPLYRHLVREIGIAGPVGLGYIVLPKKAASVGASLAEWTETDLEDADRAARDVVRKIREEAFWPPTDPPPKYSEDLAPICLDGVFGRRKWK